MDNLKAKKALITEGDFKENLIPKGPYLLIKYVYPEQTGSIIVLPESEEKPNMGEVLAISDDVVGKCNPAQYPSIGQKVYFQQGLQLDLYLDNRERPSHCFAAWYDIIAVVEE